MKTENYTPSPFSTHTIRIILNPSPSTHTHAASNYFVFFQENYLKETKIKKKLKGSAHTFFAYLYYLCVLIYIGVPVVPSRLFLVLQQQQPEEEIDRRKVRRKTKNFVAA